VRDGTQEPEHRSWLQLQHRKEKPNEYSSLAVALADVACLKNEGNEVGEILTQSIATK
jgi:hypothetical protein